MRVPYIYQTIHILDGRCFHLDEHISLADYWSKKIFGRHFRPDSAEVARQAAALAAKMAPRGCDRSQFVRLLVAESGGAPYELVFDEISLYRGYDMRSVTPDAVSLQYESPMPEAPTSARDAAEGLAQQLARRAGGSVAVRCGYDGAAYTADNATLFAVSGHTVYSTPQQSSVERSIALQAIEYAGLRFREEAIERAELKHFDELFFIDHRGLTALAHCDSHPYMSIISERVADALRKAFM